MNSPNVPPPLIPPFLTALDDPGGAHPQVVELPAGLQNSTAIPWWEDLVTLPTEATASTIGMSLDELLIETLEHSERIGAVRATPFIRETFVPEATAEFDWTAFLESRFDDTSDPVGNVLTTGGATRFKEHLWNSRGGVRKRTSTGAELEISQQLGYQDNNSRFFVPTQQGSANLLLNFSQPLLNGAGKVYNESRIVLANMESESARHEEFGNIQAHLLAVTRAYWNLYRSRAALVQKERLYQAGVSILQTLQARQALDTMPSQIARARGAVASRHAAVLRARSDVRNIETRLRSLVNSPRLQSSATEPVELLPVEAPRPLSWNVALEGSRAMAMENRPDVAQALKSVHAATVRSGMARRELLPVLDLVLSSYVAGLEGRSHIPQAFTNQFHVGQPSYSIGLVFEVPLGNRAAKARQQRRELELSRAMHEFREIMETGLAEVGIAVREIETTLQELESRRQSMTAARMEVRYLNDRWELAPRDAYVASLLLEQLLDAQDRLAAEELEFVNAQVNHVLAVVEWKRATGTALTAHPPQTPVADPEPPVVPPEPAH